MPLSDFPFCFCFYCLALFAANRLGWVVLLNQFACWLCRVAFGDIPDVCMYITVCLTNGSFETLPILKGGH
jgi:hypothetical protein